MLAVGISLVGVALFLIGTGLVYVSNEKPLNRYKQLYLPIIALVYGIVVLLLFNQISDLIRAITNSLPFLSEINTILEISLFNFFFLLLFVLIKLIYRGIVSLAVRSYEKTTKRLIEVFYVYDEEFQHWYLREKFVGFCKIIRNLFICLIVVATVLFFCSVVFVDMPIFQMPFYPAFAVLLLGEICYCLLGTTKQNYLDDVASEDNSSSRIFQYAQLEEALDHYFGDRILQTGTRDTGKGPVEAHNDFCQELIVSDNYETRLAGGYFKALVDKNIVGNSDKEKGFSDLNHDMVLNTIRLLQGKSVMFASPFCRDFIPYLFLPINSCLLRNNKVLILYGPAVSEEVLSDYVDEGLEFVTGIAHMWTVSSLAKIDNQEVPESDIVLLPFSSLGNVGSIINNADLFNRTGFVVVIDPSSLLATYQIGLNFLAEYVSDGCCANYCIFDRNEDGLVDSLSHALRTNLTEVAATEFATGSSVGLFWEADGEPLQHRLLSGIAHYLGVGIEIGLVALKEQISQVIWASRFSVPLSDQRWIAGQYYGDLLDFAELPQEQLQMDKYFEFCNDVWCLEKQDHCFLVVEDEYRNAFEAFRQFTTRGTQESFVNVLMPNYLLRSYMVKNDEMFLCDPKAIPAFAADFAKSERNIIFSIVMAMVQLDKMIKEEEIIARLQYVGLSVVNVQEALEGLLVEHIDIGDGKSEVLPEQHIVVKEVEEYVPAIREIVTKRYYGLKDQAQYSEYFSSLRNVPLVTELPDGSELLLGSRLYGHVYQSYLPGQFIVIEGKYYEVVSISMDTGVMLRRAADHFSRRHYYRQLRSYTVSEWHIGDDIGDTRTIADIGVKRIAASIQVTTQGYIDLADYGNLEDVQKVELANIPERRYCNKSALRIEFPDAGEKVTLTLAVLVSELLVTLFPQDYSYLAVVTPCAGSLKEEGILYSYEGEYEDDAIYIIEDSLIDIGLLSCLDRNVQRILKICCDYLDWHLGMLNGKDVVEEPEWDIGELPEFKPPEVKKPLIKRFTELFKGKEKVDDDTASAQDDKKSGHEATKGIDVDVSTESHIKQETEDSEFEMELTDDEDHEGVISVFDNEESKGENKDSNITQDDSDEDFIAEDVESNNEERNNAVKGEQ